MSYVGNTPTQQAFTPAIDYFSGNGSTVAFTLSRPVASVAQVQVTVNNVAQNPSTAFTVSSNTITFTGAPSSGTNNIYVQYTSPITQVIQPGQGTVGATQLIAGSVGVTQLSATGTASASTYLRGDNVWGAVTSAFAGLGGQVFTSSGTFTVPTGVSAVKVTVVGGGGNGGTAVSTSNNVAGAGGGGGGGIAIKYVTGLTAGGTVTVTVGGVAGTSSFGAYCSATGGTSTSTATNTSTSNGAGGTGSSGDLNITGSSGAGGITVSNCSGSWGLGGSGGSAGGGAAAAPGIASGTSYVFPGAPATSIIAGSGGQGYGYNSNGAGGAANGYGNGGGGAARISTGTSTGGAGTAGIVIVEW